MTQVSFFLPRDIIKLLIIILQCCSQLSLFNLDPYKLYSFCEVSLHLLSLYTEDPTLLESLFQDPMMVPAFLNSLLLFFLYTAVRFTVFLCWVVYRFVAFLFSLCPKKDDSDYLPSAPPSPSPQVSGLIEPFRAMTL